MYELKEPMKNLGGCNHVVMCKTCVGDNLKETIFIKPVLKILEKIMNFIATIHGDVNSFNTFIFDTKPLAVASKIHVFIFDMIEWTLAFSTGEPYSPFQKLIIPFDIETWIAVGVTFAIGFLIILFLKKNCHVGWQKFMFGSLERTPHFYMLRVFFVFWSRTKCPTRTKLCTISADALHLVLFDYPHGLSRSSI